MPTLFPQTLLSCVGEGREAFPHELAALTEKIWREAYGISSQPNSCQRAGMIALAALTGQASLAA